MASRKPTRSIISATTTLSAEAQLAGMMAEFLPAVAALAAQARRILQARLPGSLELVYDNYNALAIGFAPSLRASEVILSLALYPRWVSLFFMQGAGLEDPEGRLRGTGSTVRHVVLDTLETLHDPAIQSLIERALVSAKVPLNPATPHQLVIKSISAKQRPRRPAI